MAKKQYTGTKVGITSAIAGVTMLTAGWLAGPSNEASGSAGLARPDANNSEDVQALATASPTPSNRTADSSSTSSSSGPVATTTTSSTSTSKTSRAS